VISELPLLSSATHSIAVMRRLSAATSRPSPRRSNDVGRAQAMKIAEAG
jgi:hypothetical protein